MLTSTPPFFLRNLIKIHVLQLWYFEKLVKIISDNSYEKTIILKITSIFKLF